MLHSVWFGDSGMFQLPVSPGCPRNPSCSLSPRTQQRVWYQHILRLTCSYFLCLTFIRETELYPLDNLYTAAVFSVRVTQDTLELFCFSCWAESIWQQSSVVVPSAGIIFSQIQLSHPAGRREAIATSTEEPGNCPYMAWKALWVGISLEKAVGPLLCSLSSVRYGVRLCQKATWSQRGWQCGITERACPECWREEWADALM